jgi:HlyD family secretion protein
MTIQLFSEEKGMNKKKIIPVAVVVVILTLAVLYFEVFRKLGQDGSRLEGSGTIEVTEIDISSKLAGRIITIARDEGEAVRHGEVLVRIAYDELDAQRLSVIANLNNAQRNMDRVRDLYKSGSVSKKDYDNMETLYRMAKAGYEQINAAIGNAVIASPIDGVVLEKNLEIGEIAFPGTPVLTVADIQDTWIKIYVSEPQLGQVKLGQKAIITVDSFPDRKFSGTVVSISNRAEFTPKTIQTKDERVKLMFAVKISVPNQDQSLKPGMPADAYIIKGEKK